jgi:ATPase subunit of ABC transporter with duplicated ATPase domains
MSKIVQLTAENVKRLSAVQIKPDGSIVTISGRNGQGKSSVLDAIAYALGGKATQPVKPIREGAEFASVVLELDDLIVRRRWTANDRSTLIVESKEGARFPSPQAALDRIVGQLSFDPLAFSRMKPADQVATLKAVAGLDFDELDGKHARIFAERTIINRDVKALEATVASIPEVDAPDEEVSVAALAGKHAAARELLSEIDQMKRAVQQSEDAIETSRRIVVELTRKIDAEKKLQAAKTDLIKTTTDELAGMTVPDIAAITKEMNEAEAVNRRVAAKRQRSERVARLQAARDKSSEMTKSLEAIEAEKLKTLSDSKMPVDGLSFSETGVVYNNVPFEQASAAEQLRVSVAMGLTLNPKLRVMLIRDGSLLDADSMKLLAEMAEAADSQIWVERVSDGDAVGIVIEDGQVAGAVLAGVS